MSAGSHRCKTYANFGFLLRGVGGVHHGQRPLSPSVLPSHEPPVTEESATGQALEAKYPRNALSEPLVARAEAQHQTLRTHTPDSEMKITVWRRNPAECSLTDVWRPRDSVSGINAQWPVSGGQGQPQCYGPCPSKSTDPEEPLRCLISSNRFPFLNQPKQVSHAFD